MSRIFALATRLRSSPFKRMDPSRISSLPPAGSRRSTDQAVCVLPATAILAGADFAALGVLRAAYKLGLRIPADLSQVGYDNTTLAASAPINLTSVDQAADDPAATAARLLCERMDGRSRSVLTSTTPQLIVRNTTGPPRS